MKIALAQINQTIGDFKGNLHQIEEALSKAEAAGADLAAFPENAATGPFPGDFLRYDSFVRDNLALIEHLTARASRTGILIGYVRQCSRSNRLENAAALIADGQILSTHVKTRLSVHGAYDEFRYFEPGDTVKPVEFRGVNLAVTLCADICRPDFPGNRRTAGPQDPTGDAVARGAELILNLAASPFSLENRARRLHALRECAVRHQRPLVFVNQVGGHDEWIFDGQSLALDASGNIIACAEEFSEDLLVVDVDTVAADTVEAATEPDVESVVRGLILGTKDTVRKQRGKGVLVELSDNINTSVTAAVAAAALGAANVHTVSFSSDTATSAVTVNPSELAACIGIEHRLCDAPRLEQLERALGTLFSPRLSAPESSDSQQAAREIVLREIAANEGLMLVGSDDKTELYLRGPSLMDADLLMLADVPKSLVWEAARHLGEMGIPAFRNLPATPPEPGLKISDGEGTLISLEQVDQILDHCLVQLFDVDTVISLGFDAAATHAVVRAVQQTESRRRRAPQGLNITTQGFGTYPHLPISHNWKSLNR